MMSSYQISQPKPPSLFNPKKNDEITPVFVPKSTIHYEMAVRKEIKNHSISENLRKTVLPVRNEPIPQCHNFKSSKMNNAKIELPNIYEAMLISKRIPVFISRKTPNFKLTNYCSYNHGKNTICELLKEATAIRHKRQ